MHVTPNAEARIVAGHPMPRLRQRLSALERAPQLAAELLYVRRLRRKLLENASGDVLEIAIGNGKNLEFYPFGCHITGVDRSEATLDRARARAARLSLHAQFEVMDVEALGFADESFDTVVDTFNLYSFADPLAALKELSRVCRRSGRVLLLEHVRSRHAWLSRIGERTITSQPGAEGSAPNSEPLDLVRESGLRVVHAERHVAGLFHLVWAINANK
jgi:SAM-dependent methyltransferase